jgi:hypothetical protein
VRLPSHCAREDRVGVGAVDQNRLPLLSTSGCVDVRERPPIALVRSSRHSVVVLLALVILVPALQLSITNSEYGREPALKDLGVVHGRC